MACSTPHAVSARRKTEKQRALRRRHTRSYERTSVALRPLKPLGSRVALGTRRAHLANLSGCDIDLDMLVFFLALGDLSEEYRLLFLHPRRPSATRELVCAGRGG
jgi:hypothetical protein